MFVPHAEFEFGYIGSTCGTKMELHLFIYTGSKGSGKFYVHGDVRVVKLGVENFVK